MHSGIHLFSSNGDSFSLVQKMHEENDHDSFTIW